MKTLISYDHPKKRNTNMLCHNQNAVNKKSIECLISLSSHVIFPQSISNAFFTDFFPVRIYLCLCAFVSSFYLLNSDNCCVFLKREWVPYKHIKDALYETKNWFSSSMMLFFSKLVSFLEILVRFISISIIKNKKRLYNYKV